MHCNARWILELTGYIWYVCLLRLRGGYVVVVVEYQAAGLADIEHKYTSKSNKDLKIMTNRPTNSHDCFTSS